MRLIPAAAGSDTLMSCLDGRYHVVRRIFIVWARPLFHESVRALLNHPSIQIVGDSSEHAATESHIRSLQPDTIILEETEEAPITNLDISRLLDTGAPALRVVRMSLEDNVLWIYHREQRIVQQAGDLLQFLQHD